MIDHREAFAMLDKEIDAAIDELIAKPRGYRSLAVKAAIRPAAAEMRR